ADTWIIAEATRPICKLLSRKTTKPPAYPFNDTSMSKSKRKKINRSANSLALTQPLPFQIVLRSSAFPLPSAPFRRPRRLGEAVFTVQCRDPQEGFDENFR
ncbi:hypothetical protein, partial [Paracoccus siganidrum]|uniref:hypothetical protein n=1 Tax=Paracoccus siganidrum TaxID=1276757 RepID=UPI001981C781